MFPPTKVEHPYEFLSGLLNSLSRGGGSFNQDVLVDQTEQGLQVIIGLLDSIPTAARIPMRNYIKAYAKEAGWCLRNLRLTKNRLMFELIEQHEASGRS